MAKDLIHNAVREALEKDGWKVTQDPFTVDLYGDDTYFDIDLAQRKFRRIVIPVESLQSKSNRLQVYLFCMLSTRRLDSF